MILRVKNRSNDRGLWVLLFLLAILSLSLFLIPAFVIRLQSADYGVQPLLVVGR
jgi:hypothetical protein